MSTATRSRGKVWNDLLTHCNQVPWGTRKMRLSPAAECRGSAVRESPVGAQRSVRDHCDRPGGRSVVARNGTRYSSSVAAWEDPCARRGRKQRFAPSRNESPPVAREGVRGKKPPILALNMVISYEFSTRPRRSTRSAATAHRRRPVHPTPDMGDRHGPPDWCPRRWSPPTRWSRPLADSRATWW